MATDWDLVSSYAGLLSLAVSAIYAGSFGSLSNVRRGAKVEGTENVDAEDEEEEQVVETLSSQDAWLFPVIGSAALLGLYLVVKYFGTAWINWVLGWYFAFAGVGSVGKSLLSLSRFLAGEKWKGFDKIHLLVLKGPRELSSISIRTPTLALLPLGALPSILYTLNGSVRKSALLTDILALSFAHNALSILKIDSFKTGSILLSGLFLYDIWWVFGTEVMVKVATNLDIPIKLLWPKSITLSSTARGFTMLGLGDVVIPGTFIALALRYDQHRFLRSGPADTSAKNFGKPYFYAALMAYVAGLATTMSVMHVFQAAQPALLYLSPACILSFLITASVRGELKDAWSWSDAPQEGAEPSKQETNGYAEPKKEAVQNGATNGAHEEAH